MSPRRRLRLVGYSRVSRVGGRGGESFISTTVQREQIESYATANGHTLVAMFEDLDESGGKASRPQFDRGLALVESGQADGLIVAKLDRFMRSLPHALAIIERLEAAGKQLISVSDNFDSSTPMGRFARDIVIRLGQLERERISESWKDSLANANRRGIHVASRTPTGYRRRADGRLEPDPVAAPVIRELFLKRAAGETWQKLADHLNDSGISGPYGSPNWTRSAASKIVKNRVYRGEARSNQYVNKEAHEALVSESEWRAANRKNGNQQAPPRAVDTLLSGLLRCSSCRYVMKADKHGRPGAKVRSYRCRGDHAAGKCPAPAFALAHVIEPYVEQLFLYQLREGGRLYAEGAPAVEELGEALAELERAESELEGYVVAASALDAALFEKGLEPRQAAVDQAMAAVHELESRTQSVVSVDLASEWDTLTTVEKRRILAGYFDAVMLRPMSALEENVAWDDSRTKLDGRVAILWKGDDPAFANFPRRGHRPPLESYIF